MPDKTRTLDPVTLTVLWNRIIASVDEAAATLVRTAFSTVVRESNDYACVLMDAHGRSLAQNSVAAPSFVGTMPRTMQRFLKRFPVSTWREGDAVVTNDPWIGTGHLPDFSIAVPIFRHGQLIGFAGNVAHSPDVGGGVWSADAQEMFEEGIRIPPCKIVEAGQMNELLLDIIANNVRVPDLTLGDLHAQIAACQTQAERLLRVMEEYELEDLEEVSEEIIGRSESAFRDAVREIPDGVYHYALTTDGFDEPLTIRVRIEVDDSDMRVDYSGTSPQIRRGLNSTYNYTFAYTAFPLKCLLVPDIPNNDGMFRSLDVHVPEGTLLNPRFPAPVGARNMTGHFLAAVVFGALAQAIPERITAEPGAPSNRSLIAGQTEQGEPFSVILFTSGGMAGQHDRDGLTCAAFPSNAGFASLEITENVAPLLFREKSIRTDSAGMGAFRGGFGQTIAFQLRPCRHALISSLMDRVRHPARGILGGEAGLPAALLRNGEPINSKGRTELRPGDTITIACPGGGGYGPRSRRNPALSEQDVRNGLITVNHYEVSADA